MNMNVYAENATHSDKRVVDDFCFETLPRP